MDKLNPMTHSALFRHCHISLDVKANALALAKLLGFDAAAVEGADQSDIQSHAKQAAQVERTRCAVLICAAMFEHLSKGHSCLPLHVLNEERWFAQLDANEDSVDANDDSGHQDLGQPKQGIIFREAFSEGKSQVNVLTEVLASLCGELEGQYKSSYHLKRAHQALYFAHYYDLEAQLAAQISQKIRVDPFCESTKLQPYFEALFASKPTKIPTSKVDAESEQSPIKTPDQEINLQALAVGNSLYQKFSIINGGPGTGKTYTASRLLALLQVMQPNLRIMLGAPTGKAAQRLGDSIAKALEEIAQESLFKNLYGNNAKNLSALNVQTVHRILGLNPSRMYAESARYHEKRFIPCDVLLIDEVSMLDLHLALQVFKACGPNTRIIFLGDSAQLPAVEAGSLLSDLLRIAQATKDQCDNERARDFFAPLAKIICPALRDIQNSTEEDDISKKQECTLNASGILVTLTRNFRSNAQINQLAAAVSQGDARALKTALEQGKDVLTDLCDSENDEAQNDKAQNDNHQTRVHALIKRLSREVFAPMTQASSALMAMQQFLSIRLLSPLRRGMYGVEGLNQQVIDALGEGNQHLQYAVNLEAEAFMQKPWFKGMPIMITQNDMANGLSNGDIGIVWPSETGDLFAYFFDEADISRHEVFKSNSSQYKDESRDAPSGKVRKVSRYRLPKYETAYAMTIHKSQGSEFDRVAIVLPETESELCQRELLFTGVTRARIACSILSTGPILRSCLQGRLTRHSCLSSQVRSLRALHNS